MWKRQRSLVALCLALCSAAFIVSTTSTAHANPSAEQAQRELPYLRMSLVMNSVLHLIQWPLSLDKKLKLPRSRAIVSMSGGLLYAGTAGLSFSKKRSVQLAGTGSFMTISAVGAGFVTGSLISCALHKKPESSEEMGCRARFFDALNIAILLNQVVAWSLGARQFRADRPSPLGTVEMPLLEAQF